MTLSVVIVSYNLRHYLSLCLRSILASKFEGSLEIIVVDNNSHDDTAEFLRIHYPDIKVIANSVNPGFAAALNQGLKSATGGYILSLNPDTVIGETTLQVLVDYLEANVEVGCVGPKIINTNGTFQAAAKRSIPTPMAALAKFLALDRLFPQSKWLGRYNLTYLGTDTVHRVGAISGACMCFRQSMLETVGEMDEDYFIWSDDLDYCYRITKAGYAVVYNPDAIVLHFKGAARVLSPKWDIYFHYTAMGRFIRKYPEAMGGRFPALAIRMALLLTIVLIPLRWLSSWIIVNVRNLLSDWRGLPKALIIQPSEQTTQYERLTAHFKIAGAVDGHWRNHEIPVSEMQLPWLDDLGRMIKEHKATVAIVSSNLDQYLPILEAAWEFQFAGVEWVYLSPEGDAMMGAKGLTILN